MYQRLFIGHKLINLKEVNSTNVYLKQLISDNEKEIEGLVVVAENQFDGRGQKDNVWETELGKNLTFSILLKPNIEVSNQFLLSKLVSLGIVDFLNEKGLTEVSIKWPNDIYYRDKKIAGILIENSIRGSQIHQSVVGVGLNVDQTDFSDYLPNPTSIKLIGVELGSLKESLEELLFFIEKKYLMLRSGKIDIINDDYLKYLYRINEPSDFLINNKVTNGTILGVTSSGHLQIKINNEIKVFDLKEVKFL